jgi:hypothetical protein
VKARSNSELNCFVVDTDYGCGILRKRKNENILRLNLSECLQWNYFERNKKEILNLTDTKQFFNLETRL